VRALLAIIALTVRLPAQQDSTWRQHDQAAREARLRGDWAASRAHVERMDVALTGHPAVIAALARASVHLGDTARVVRELERLASAGVWYDVDTDSALSLVRSAPAIADVVARLRANLAPTGTFTPVATLPERDFVAEGIVWDTGRQRLLVSSIRHRRIDTVGRDGTVARFIDLARDSALSPLGLAIDPQRNRLWVSTEWTPIALNANPADSGRAAVLRYELRSGRLRARYELPRGGGPHEPGDIAVAPNGDLFVSDGRAGVVYVIRDGSRALDTLVRSGPLVSPQGLAPDTDGKRVFVADYALGIVAFDRGTGAVAPVPRPANVAANGVDGLILAGNSLIGVQNGVTPNRLIAFDLDPSHSRVVGARTLVRDTTRIREPTHLVAVGSEVFYIANGGFGVYDERGVLRPGASQVAPVVARFRSQR
jgi:sugar lactone lactonase YvrE